MRLTLVFLIAVFVLGPKILDGANWVQYEYFEKPRIEAAMGCYSVLDKRHPGEYPVDQLRSCMGE